MKQVIKKDFERGVDKRLSDPDLRGTTSTPVIINAVSSTLLSAIEKGYEKIRINDALHVTVKKHKGGKTKRFGQGEVTQNPDYYVLRLLITPEIARALNIRD